VQSVLTTDVRICRDEGVLDRAGSPASPA